LLVAPLFKFCYKCAFRREVIKGLTVSKRGKRLKRAAQGDHKESGPRPAERPGHEQPQASSTNIETHNERLEHHEAEGTVSEVVIAKYTRSLAKWTMGLVFVGAITIAILVAHAFIFHASDVTLKDTLRANKAVQRAFVFLANIDRERAIRFSDGATVGWNFRAVWKNGGSTPTKKLFIRTSGRAFPTAMPPNYVFPEMFEATEALIGPQATMVGANMGLEIRTLEQARDGKQFLYLWGSAEYDDIFDNSPRYRTEFCVQVIVAGDFAKDNVVFVFTPCATNNRSYEVDRSAQREEYKGPEAERLGEVQKGVRLSLPPKPLQ
jgi:hypothetical protein